MNKVQLFIILLFSVTASAQVSVYGNWRINTIIGIRDAKEYSMVPQDANNRWGYLLTLNLDGTFVSRNLPPCGNDIFLSTNGNFILIDETHIRFVLEGKSSSSYNEDPNVQSELNKDLGVFYIYKDSKSVRLIASNGVLQDDIDKMVYTEMLNTFDQNWKSYDYSWVDTKAKIPREIVKDCVDNRKMIDLSRCKIMLSKKEPYGELFLVGEKDKFHYILYSDFNQKVTLAYPR